MGATVLSAGLLLFRRKEDGLEVLLVHPGGPFFARKDEGVWTIPKGLVEAGEDALLAAQRELREETGIAPSGEFISLGELRQPSGKIVVAWAIEQDADATQITSNTFSMEWPPKSGRLQQFPEIDRAGWFTLEEAHVKILKGQAGFLEMLGKQLC